jgi:flagellar protein FliO/FliZ
MFNIDLVRSIASLSFVLIVLFALAWLLKRTKGKTLSRTSVARVVGGVALGARERVVVVEIASRWIVVGLSSGHMSALANLEAITCDAPAPLENAGTQAAPSKDVDPKGILKDFSSFVRNVVKQ